jgi:hypothetical protein
MKILQNEITGTQTSFSINFGGKLSFIAMKILQNEITETQTSFSIQFWW